MVQAVEKAAVEGPAEIEDGVERHQVLDRWGFARRLSLGKGVNALYRGELGKDLVTEARAPHTADGVSVIVVPLFVPLKLICSQSGNVLPQQALFQPPPLPQLTPLLTLSMSADTGKPVL